MLRPKPKDYRRNEAKAIEVLTRRLFGEDRLAWHALPAEKRTERAQQLIACGDPWLVTRDIIREDLDKKEPFPKPTQRYVAEMTKKEDPHVARRLRRLEKF
jgi:hypothetical protein